MAKKKAASRKTAKRPVKKKPAAKLVKKTGNAKRAGKPPAKKAVRTPAARSRKRLGRPKVTADARLDVLFQKDYQAREVFAFLKVETVRELERHTPADVIEQMTRPLVQTVDRIRKALALSNRALCGDEEFAVTFLEQLGG